MDWQLDERYGDVWFCQMTPELALFAWHCPTYQSGEPIEGHHWNYGVAEAPDGQGIREYRTGTAPTFNTAKLCALASYEAGPNAAHDRLAAAIEDIEDAVWGAENSSLL